MCRAAVWCTHVGVWHEQWIKYKPGQQQCSELPAGTGQDKGKQDVLPLGSGPKQWKIHIFCLFCVCIYRYIYIHTCWVLSHQTSPTNKSESANSAVHTKVYLENYMYIYYIHILYVYDMCACLYIYNIHTLYICIYIIAKFIFFIYIYVTYTYIYKENIGCLGISQYNLSSSIAVFTQLIIQ